MASEKQRTKILLIVLGATIIGSVFYYFFYLKNPNIDKPEILQVDNIEQAKIQEVYNAKEIAIENVFDFLVIKNFEYSIFDKLIEREQYQSLQGREIIIDTDTGVGNQSPFDVIPYGVDEEEGNPI